MGPRTTAILGIVGTLLFIVTAVISGFQFEDYSHASQFISEAYAFGTPYGLYLRIFGYIPSGILLALFGFGAKSFFKKSILIKLGLIGFAVFYGLGTVVVSIFPCDMGCTIAWADSSFSQIIHNLFSGATYLIVPWCLIFVGMGLRKLDEGIIAIISLVLGAISGLFVLVLISDPNSDLIGLFQRIIEACILSWVFLFSVFILRKKANSFAHKP